MEEIERLKTALQWYADRKHILGTPEEKGMNVYIMKFEDSSGSEMLTSVENGDIARKALDWKYQ